MLVYLWGKNVPGEVVNKVETVKMNWINDELDTWYPFSEERNRMEVKFSAGVIKRPELETMQFFVKGKITFLLNRSYNEKINRFIFSHSYGWFFMQKKLLYYMDWFTQGNQMDTGKPSSIISIMTMKIVIKSG